MPLSALSTAVFAALASSTVCTAATAPPPFSKEFKSEPSVMPALATVAIVLKAPKKPPPLLFGGSDGAAAVWTGEFRAANLAIAV